MDDWTPEMKQLYKDLKEDIEVIRTGSQYKRKQIVEILRAAIEEVEGT